MAWGLGLNLSNGLGQITKISAIPIFDKPSEYLFPNQRINDSEALYKALGNRLTKIYSNYNRI